MLTLEKIAPYLPYGVSVVSPKDVELEGEIVKANTPYAVTPESLNKMLNHLDKFYLILYPFEHLITEINHNGKDIYPIVEIAKLIGAEPKDFKLILRKPKTNVTPENTWYEMQYGDDQYIYTFIIRQDWYIRYFRMLGLYRLDKEFEIYPMVKLADFLRSMHFAVGLDRDNYVHEKPQ